MSEASDPIRRYHDGTKHDFNRFARSAGYLDWASQPSPFRHYADARRVPLFPSPSAGVAGASASAAALGDLLRHALGLSAWKQYGQSRWSLRVNPSSGNLHPTEAYIVCGATPGLADVPAVYHYAPDDHALEERCRFAPGAWTAATASCPDAWLIALTSIHWRESWKYGERAFRYCQHDLGHAMAAVAIAARLVGRRAVLLAWSHRDLAAMTGVDRDADFVDAEREEPGCVVALVPEAAEGWTPDLSALVAAAVAGSWTGRASQLSEDHVQWTFIDEIANATRWARLPSAGSDESAWGHAELRTSESEARHQRQLVKETPGTGSTRRRDRALLLQRRSAVAFDGRSGMPAETFFGMLAGVMPASTPWDLLWWTPRVHLVLFVHRVDGVAPGLYLLTRDGSRGAHASPTLDRVRVAFGRDFLWESAHDDLPLVCLARGHCTGLARRLSCDQDIAADGAFSLGMLADFDRSLDEFGPAFYRHLFWESGVVGQVLYLAAEAAGLRATGIGCFYDDPVHAVLGLEGHAFQSLYHFTVGMPVEDGRLTTSPGYAWEASGDGSRR